MAVDSNITQNDIDEEERLRFNVKDLKRKVSTDAIYMRVPFNNTISIID